MATPSWSSARDGMPGDANAVNQSNQINQYLGVHASRQLYQGNEVVMPDGIGAGSADPDNYWIFHLDTFDYDQPFTMSGTTVGRVGIPLLPVGNGADLLVSLCPDSSGSPGTPIVQTRIPAKWISAFAGVAGVPTATSSMALVNTPGPLALPQYNTLQVGSWQTINWSLPSTSATGNPNPTTVQDGNYVIMVGGTDSVSSTTIPYVFTIQWGGGTALNPPIPQPSLPQSGNAISVAVVGGYILAAGGENISTGGSPVNTYTAAWNNSTGVVSSWTPQAALPAGLFAASTAVWNNTVYIVGGQSTGTGFPVTNVLYWATISNGQIQSWNTATIPVAVSFPLTFVLGNILVVAGGFNGTTNIANTYYANIHADGSLGAWQNGPSLFAGTTGLINGLTTGGFLHYGGTYVQAITAGTTGLSAWTTQGDPYTTGHGQPGLFSVGQGQWQQFLINATSYYTVPVYATPVISVPLPATGLTNGVTYHVTLQQRGGDLNDYSRTRVDFDALPGNPTALYRARGGGSWSSYFTGYAIPIAVYDQTVGGPVWHTWQDSGARITTMAYATTPDTRLLGIAEATQFLDGTQNSTVTQINYSGTWPAGVWPPIGTTQLS